MNSASSVQPAVVKLSDPFQNIGIVVLAAGASSRLGRPKQLLPFQGSTLLQIVLDVATSARTRPVVLVLGALAPSILEATRCDAVLVVHNEEWMEGIASSIRVGLQALLKLDPNVEGLILMTCDQPFVHPGLLQAICQRQRETGKPIVACSYAGIQGIPAYFDKGLFPELMRLSGNTGARHIIRSNPAMVDTVEFPEGALDVDTEVDVRNMSTESGRRV